MPKSRLDTLLVERKLATSRTQAQRMVMAGQVRVDGQTAVKAGMQVSPEANIQIEAKPRYVSRGGEKLAAALEAFSIEIDGKVCADVGASTGGFTDCLLQHGARRVYAIDVGQGILAWRLRNHPQVINMEGVNVRFLESLPEAVEIITVDVSFISLKLLLPLLWRWFDDKGGNVITLIKPQFEAGRRQVARGQGVIRDPHTHQQVLHDVLNFAQETGYQVKSLIRSPLIGPKGNLEFLAWLVYPGQANPQIEQIIRSVLS